MILIRIAAALMLLGLGATPSWTQSSGGFVSGQELPAASLNAQFSNKADLSKTNAVVASYAALQALPAGQFNSVWRAGYAAAGDGGDGLYLWSSTACTISGGDGGSQVPPGSGTGCWNLQPTAQRVTPMIFGATANCVPVVTNGVGNYSSCTDETTVLQAAFNAASAAGVPLYFDSNHLYLTSSALNMTNPLVIEGTYRFGFWTVSPATSTIVYCPWGIVNISNTVMINASAVTGTIRNMCLQASSSVGNIGSSTTVSATAGAAIQLAPPTVNTNSTGWHIEKNTIINPYNGITINGVGEPTMGTPCCGLGSSADGIFVGWNTIQNAAADGIAVGKNTYNANTVGVTLYDNAIGCISASARVNSFGVHIYDGSIAYDGTENGPEGCSYGFAVTPGGTSSSLAQNAAFNPATGVLGDQSQVHDLLIQPLNQYGTVNLSLCSACWASTTYAGVNPVLISNDNGGNIDGVNFTGSDFHSGAGATVPIIDIEAFGSTALFQHIQFIGDEITCMFGGNCSAPLVKINGTASSYPARMMFTGNHIGYNDEGGTTTCSLGMAISGPGTAYLTIVGNDLNDCSTSYTVSGNAAGGINARTLLASNLGVYPFFSQDSPGNPTGTTVTSGYAMMGINKGFTPQTSGNVTITLNGNENNNTVGDGVHVLLVYGTGTAPTNGQSFTGTACNATAPYFTAISGLNSAPYAIVCNIQNLNLQQSYWIDVAVQAVGGGTASTQSMTDTVTER